MQTSPISGPVRNEVFDQSVERHSILIVDDDSTLLDVFQSGLTSIGYACETTTSAMMALEMINTALFDIILIDIELPNINGLELSRKVKRLYPEKVIIIMTGHVTDFDYDAAIEAGASDFIKKPFSLKELIVRIKQIRMGAELHRRKKELKKKMNELEEFYDMAVGRELRMKQLKAEVENLKEELARYKN